jgi:hypothetical protein
MEPEEIAARAEKVTDDLRARGNRLCLAYADVSIAYCSDEDAPAELIGRFFEGYFLPSDARVANATVYSTGDPELFSALQRLGSEQVVDGKHDYVDIPFTTSATLIRKQAGESSTVEDVYLLLFKKERKVVLVTSGNLEVSWEEGMQTLRAVGKWLLLERGWIPMHSACAGKNGRTICVTGPKGSGKTSTLLNLLARNGCDLVAVDKFLVRDAGFRMEACGIPGKIGIRVGSAVVQPRVMNWLSEPTAHFFPHLSAEEVQHIAGTNTPAQLRTRKEKIHMIPAELVGLFGGSISVTAPLGLLLIPVFDLSLAEARLVRVEPEQAIPMLMDCYVGLLSKGEGFLLDFFDLDDAQLRERLAALLATYLPEVGIYEVHQNHRTNEQAAELVAGLL